jgi:hypothetical protein
MLSPRCNSSASSAASGEEMEHTRSGFIFDSLVFEPLALRYLIDLVGADHVCIGPMRRTRWPMTIPARRSTPCPE